jgi:repressor LexA
MQKLTARQQRVLDFIETYIDSNDQSPSLFDIKQFLGVRALSTVHQHIRALENKGYLQRDNNTSRGINYVMNAGKYIGEFIRIPMVGTIIAGYPIDAVEEVEEYIAIPSNQLNSANMHKFFALRVKGDSMIDSYIKEGDIVIAEKSTEPRDGDMVVALNSEGEATLKHFYNEGKRVRLQPANPKYKAIYYQKGEIQIQGKVVQVVRKYI